MLPNVVHHLLDADCLQLFGVCCAFVENLSVQIVVVIFDEAVCFPQQEHNVHALLDLLRREVGPEHWDVELVLA